MDRLTIEQLLAINRQFYTGFARSFADSRTLSDPAIICILPDIPPGARVLDVGCGNGRLALLLDRERPGVQYVGLDAIPELVEIARQQSEQLSSIAARFHQVDIARAGWHRDVPGAPFDRVLLLAVLHHIPGWETRAQVLRESAALLAPAGHLILSTWQFLDTPRLRRKLLPWETVGIPEETLEAGDYLLDWKRGGQGVRYCHLVDETEIERLATETGLRVRRTFRAGGREGNLSLFAVLMR